MEEEWEVFHQWEVPSETKMDKIYITTWDERKFVFIMDFSLMQKSKIIILINIKVKYI